MTIGTCRHLVIQAWLKNAVCIIFCGPMLTCLLVASRAVPPVAGVLVHILGIFWRWEEEEGWRILLICCFCFRFCGGCYHGASLASIPSMQVECDVGSTTRRGGGKTKLFYLFYLDQNRNTLWLVIWSSLLPTASSAWEEVWSLSLIQHLQFNHPRNLLLAVTSSS
jgi:hypothetical protein